MRVERYGYDLLMGQQAITPLPFGAVGNYPIADWGQQAFTPLPFGAVGNYHIVNLGSPMFAFRIFL